VSSEPLGAYDSADSGTPDIVEVRGLELLLYCGVLEEEQARRQPFRFDLDLHLDLSAAGQSDDLTDTVNYGALIDLLAITLPAERFQLLERLAARAAELALSFPSVDTVTVRVRKLRPPVASIVATTGVRIHRTRNG